MSDTERRGSTRFITILPLSILGPKGEVMDSAATAHDLSSGGFKAECSVELKEGATFGFRLELPDGAPATGEARAVWVKRDDFATWIGARITRLSWSDRRRLKAAIAGPGLNWGPILDSALTALVWLTVAAAVHRIVFDRPMWRQTVFGLVPSFFALIVMGWALSNLLRRR